MGFNETERVIFLSNVDAVSASMELDDDKKKLRTALYYCIMVTANIGGTMWPYGATSSKILQRLTAKTVFLNGTLKRYLYRKRFCVAKNKWLSNYVSLT